MERFVGSNYSKAFYNIFSFQARKSEAGKPAAFDFYTDKLRLISIV